MNIDALIWMATVDVSVTAFTAYFFYKVLFTKTKTHENASDSED